MIACKRWAIFVVLLGVLLLLAGQARGQSENGAINGLFL